MTSSEEIGRRIPSPTVDPRYFRIATALGSAPDDLGWVRAPGRVNLMGDHTDYHDGFVLPLAIDRDCLVALRRRSDRHLRARSLEEPTPVELDLDSIDAGEKPRDVEPTWGRFLAGAAAATGLAATGPGLDIALSSTVPAGSGLSSSSALTVALVLAMADAAGATLDPAQAARVALRAEILATGVPGGLMDQLTSLLGRAGHALLLDCRTLAARPIPLPAGLAVLAMHTGLPRVLARSEYATRRAACDASAERIGVRALRDATLDQVVDDPIARHVVTENARVLATADALRADDHLMLGRLLAQSHASLRDDFDVSTPELDALVDALVDAGAIGARLTGAGFGGCVVALAARSEVDSVARRAAATYRAASGLEAQAFVVTAVDGAAVLAGLPPE